MAEILPSLTLKNNLPYGLNKESAHLTSVIAGQVRTFFI
jgi:hypothetical protein